MFIDRNIIITVFIEFSIKLVFNENVYCKLNKFIYRFIDRCII